MLTLQKAFTYIHNENLSFYRYIIDLERWLQNSHSKATIRLQHTDVFLYRSWSLWTNHIPHLYALYCDDYTLTDGDTV